MCVLKVCFIKTIKLVAYRELDRRTPNVWLNNNTKTKKFEFNINGGKKVDSVI